MQAGGRKVATVFGGSGFIGRYVVKRLAERGHIVRVAVRDPEAALFLKPMGAPGQIVPVGVSVTDDAGVAAVVSGAEIVVNLVGILHETRKATFKAIQGEAPGRIGRAAAAAGARAVVQLSAIGADAASPSAYARTKAEGEHAVREAFPKATVLRPSIVFGPEDGFFNRFAALAQFVPALPLYGGGETKFQPVYVGDVADAVIAALDRADAAGRTYELGGPRVYSFRDLLQYILTVTGRRRLLLPLPWSVGRMQARVFELLPNPPLTRDQLLLLQRDNVVAPGALTLADLGIMPKAVEAIVPGYLGRFRRRAAARIAAA
ncbi:complex I NDUFA9 subunit family protein [Elioraea tepidiphila]|uniref:complex I NDUFA9 subunit family protein n=1 Tax=Elioraea tepidiphila TaxID=457934 RepID=UPI000371A1CC|nr:complex I NDUFA9 subunit family protein [Elioraea tepidiphila]